MLLIFYLPTFLLHFLLLSVVLYAPKTDPFRKYLLCPLACILLFGPMKALTGDQGGHRREGRDLLCSDCAGLAVLAVSFLVYSYLVSHEKA